MYPCVGYPHFSWMWCWGHVMMVMIMMMMMMMIIYTHPPPDNKRCYKFVNNKANYEGYKGVNWQPSKSLNIYRQPRFREIFNRQMTKWQSSVKREIYSGQKKSWVRLRVTSPWGIKCQNARSYPGARNISVLTAYFTDKAIILLILTKGPKF